MRRILVGILLVLHGLAHANAGMLAADGFRIAPTVVWALASVSLMAAGFGLFGVRRLNRYWQILALIGVSSSLLMLIVYHPATAVPGIAVDVALLGVLSFVFIPRLEWSRPGRWASIGEAAAFAVLTYMSVAILSRPWHSRWGSTKAELAAALPGDSLVPNAHYTIQHAVTIRATPAEVWPWLAQLGQDRGGFYSYDWLERAIGDRIKNADRIHPEWQTVRKGDLVRATQPDYLGGRFGRDIGWRVTEIEPGRVLALGGWGAFVLEPTADGKTRLIVRTRGNNKPNVALAPFGLLVFEPAHFIMQREMLRGIKARAEREARRAGTAPV